VRKYCFGINFQQYSSEASLLSDMNMMLVSTFEVRSVEAMLNVESRNARKVICIRNRQAMDTLDNVLSCGK